MKTPSLLALLLAAHAAAANVQKPVTQAIASAIRGLPPAQQAAAVGYLAGRQFDLKAVVPLEAGTFERALAKIDAAPAGSAEYFETARKLNEMAHQLTLTEEEKRPLQSAYQLARAQASAEMQVKLDAMAAALGKSQDAGAVLALSSGKEVPGSRLQPSRLSDAQIKERIKTSPRGLNEAVFKADEFKPEYEARAKALGADILTINNPTAAQLAKHSEADGFYLTTEKLRWLTPLEGSAEKYLEPPKEGDNSRWPPTKIRSRMRADYNRDVKRSEGVVTPEFGPLTAERYAEWYPVWQKEVGGKPGAYIAWKPDFVQSLPPEELPDWYMMTYRDNATGKIIGGSVMNDWKERRFFTLGAAAYSSESKAKFELSLRSLMAGIKKATELGYSVFAYGADLNLYGYDFNLGLNNFKVGMGLVAFPEGVIQLRKVVNGEKFRALKNKAGQSDGMFFYALKRDGPFVERYLEKQASAPAAHTLLGGQYFAEGTLKAGEAWRGVHLTESDAAARTAEVIALEKKPLP